MAIKLNQETLSNNTEFYKQILIEENTIIELEIGKEILHGKFSKRKYEFKVC